MIEPISSAVVAELTKDASAATLGKEAIAEATEAKESAEIAVKESPIESQIDTIENTSLESLEAQNNEKINTINKSLEGTQHPETGVPFESKTVETYDGKKIEGVFPDFKDYKVFEVKLPENLLQATDAKQFEYCNEKLKESFDKGTLHKENFTERQWEQLSNGDKPEGYTWHHNEVKGKMELVRTDIHQATGHTGGRSIWGGGNEGRY